jgi:hypothetical protein
VQQKSLSDDRNDLERAQKRHAFPAQQNRLAERIYDSTIELDLRKAVQRMGSARHNSATGTQAGRLQRLQKRA